MEELDLVELLTSIAGADVDHTWPAGTEAVILELWEDRALIEIANDNGETLDMPTVPREQLKVVWVNATHSWVDPDQSSSEIRVSARTRAK